MRKYGSKKASRTNERIHKHHCSLCDSHNETPIKTRRAFEKTKAVKEIKEYELEG